MIKSPFILDIMKLLIDGFEQEANLRNQLLLLTEMDMSYTGAGLIVTFNHEASISKYRIDFDVVLNGVRIESPCLHLGAQSSIFFEDGIISYLEIFSNSSEYPRGSLGKYRLTQEWVSDGGKVIEGNWS